jgi:hypothetical protein
MAAFSKANGSHLHGLWACLLKYQHHYTCNVNNHSTVASSLSLWSGRRQWPGCSQITMVAHFEENVTIDIVQ